MDQVVFKTVKEIADWLREKDYGAVLSFTDDTPETLEFNGEPTGWYGVKKVNEFDGDSLIYGYYGAGIVYSDTIANNLPIELSIKEFFNSEFNMEIDLGDKICVDKKEWG